jgi:hypothetical protein
VQRGKGESPTVDDPWDEAADDGCDSLLLADVRKSSHMAESDAGGEEPTIPEPLSVVNGESDK